MLAVQCLTMTIKVTLKNVSSQPLGAIGFYVENLPDCATVINNGIVFNYSEAPDETVICENVITLRVDISGECDLDRYGWYLMPFEPGDFNYSGKVDLLRFCIDGTILVNR